MEQAGPHGADDGGDNKDLTGTGFMFTVRNMSKYEDNDIERFSEMFKALSNPNRLKIFLRLVACCPPGNPVDIKRGVKDLQGCACVGDLGQDLGIVPSTISHHIKELRRAGLIRVERRGQKVECWMDPEARTALKGFFRDQGC
jgi:ArsR family transcriptional regulator